MLGAWYKLGDSTMQELLMLLGISKVSSGSNTPLWVGEVVSLMAQGQFWRPLLLSMVVTVFLSTLILRLQGYMIYIPRRRNSIQTKQGLRTVGQSAGVLSRARRGVRVRRMYEAIPRGRNANLVS